MSAIESSLEITIDEVVVRGMSPAEARSTVAALETRLQDLGEGWAKSGTPIAPRDEAFRPARVASPATASPVAVGDSAASAVWATIVGGERR